jgi:TPR repeat protein
MRRLFLSLLLTVLAFPPAMAAFTADEWIELRIGAERALRAQDYKQAMKLAKKMGKKDPTSLIFRAALYRNGQGVDVDLKEARELYLEAAAQGNAEAIYEAASMIERGEGGPADPAQALALYEKAGQNEKRAAARLWQVYSKGDLAPKDAAQAQRWLVRAAELGDPDASALYGPRLFKGEGVARDPKKAVKMLFAAADRKNFEAMTMLVNAFETGDGVATNVETARFWAIRAKFAGHPDAQAWLDRLPTEFPSEGIYEGGYEYDRGMYRLNSQRDQKGAFESFLQSANMGFRPAISQVVSGYYDGDLGQVKDIEKARYWARLGAELDNDYCQLVLASILRHGMTGPKDIEGAIYWYERAAARKRKPNTMAMFYLAQLYEKGEEVPANEALTLYWYKTAYAHGSTRGEAWLKAKGLLQPNPATQAFIDRIHRDGPDRSSLMAFNVDVGNYCKAGGPRCHEYTVQARQLERQHNAGAESANMQRLWNVYSKGSGVSDAEARARSECMRKKTESIQRQTYGQQDWRYEGSCY